MDEFSRGATQGAHEVDRDEATRELIRQDIRALNETLLGASAKPAEPVDAKWLTTILSAPGFTR